MSEIVRKMKFFVRIGTVVQEMTSDFGNIFKVSVFDNYPTFLPRIGEHIVIVEHSELFEDFKKRLGGLHQYALDRNRTLTFKVYDIAHVIKNPIHNLGTNWMTSVFLDLEKIGDIECKDLIEGKDSL